jgi:hypothetical protein
MNIGTEQDPIAESDEASIESDKSKVGVNVFADSVSLEASVSSGFGRRWQELTLDGLRSHT